MPPLSLYYDKNDYKLLEILDDLLDRGVDRSHFKSILQPYLKPHGIKELAADKGLRIAYAIMHLLESLKSDQASDRIKALTALRDETLTAAQGDMRNNRARVLVQIGKELIRAKGDRPAQLELAHDFRRAAVGKTGFLRKQLRRHHLLEMPEEWNQIAFDDRVHDANSKGRKSATHLVMDAWIKGIRDLTVVYYDVMNPAVARELFASARILGVTVRIGIEFTALYRGRFVKIVWGPSGLLESNDIDGFFRQDAVRRLMELGREAQARRTEYVRAVIGAFNERRRGSIRREFGVSPPRIDYEDFVRSIGAGSPSVLHLGNFIHQSLLPLFAERTAALREEFDKADYDSRAAIAMQVESMDSLDPDTIIARYLSPEENRDLPDPDAPRSQGEPELLTLSPAALTARLSAACHASRMTLILSDLAFEDVLEILYACRGRITHLEVFNAKHATGAGMQQRLPLNRLLQAVRDQNAVLLKRLVRNAMERVVIADAPDAADRLRALEAVLSQFYVLLEDYKRTPLRTSIGSGSTGRSSRTHGMGFAVMETLPPQAQRTIRKGRMGDCIPIEGSVVRSNEFVPPRFESGMAGACLAMAGRLPVLRNMAGESRCRWRIEDCRIMDEGKGNVVALGGVNHERNGLSLFDDAKSRPVKPALGRLNSTLKNALKVLLGFIPAFLTFYLTKDWWLLAWFGGVIWFGVTGLRNVIQSVLGGGGFRRSPYLSWNNYIDWERISDSLLYTGFSVPLLDWLCKSVVLDASFGVTTATNPLLLYTIMALTNGIYISGHNFYRGLPREAIAGNFFRSVLSIPVAMLFNAVLAVALAGVGVIDVLAVLQLWAAVISKFASDCVAGVIEGLADRRRNIALRRWDYSEKLKQVFAVFSDLEIAFPTRDMLKTLDSPDVFLHLTRGARIEYALEVIANALDLLYIKAFKPRAHEALKQVMRAMTRDELAIFLASQQVLAEEKRVAILFVDGLVGRNFSKALSFYLLRYRSYLDEIRAMAQAFGGKASEEGPAPPSEHRAPVRRDERTTGSGAAETIAPEIEQRPESTPDASRTHRPRRSV